MAKSTRPPLELQIRRAHRRLRMQCIVDALAAAWIIGLFAGALWLVALPWLVESPATALRWMVPAIILALATVVGIVIGFLRSPSRVDAALSIDHRFALRERVTTTWMLAPDQASTPAGIALAADVEQRIAKLDIGSRFPLYLPRWALLGPVAALALALVALFYEPAHSKAGLARVNDDIIPPASAKEIDQKMRELAKKDPKAPVREKSADLERLEAELEKIAERPRTTKEEVRERIKEMTGLEQRMKEQEKQQAERGRALKQQLQKLDKTASMEEGPAKDLEKALSQGKFEKAREEVERLSKQLQAGTMSQKDKEQLQKQLQQLKEQLSRLAEQKDREKQLRQMNLDPETLERELASLQKDKEKTRELEKLAQQLGQAEKSLKEGDSQGACDHLGQCSNQLAKMGGAEKDLDELREQLTRLGDAKDSACEGACEGKEIAESEMTKDSQSGGPGAGKRPLGQQKPFNSFDAKAKTEFDPKGKKIFDGYAPGQNFRTKAGAEMIGDIRQATQEAPEAIEQQRIPKGARDMARGYFQQMRQQADGETKK